MVLYGAGSHGKVVYECLVSQRKDIIAFVDDKPFGKLFGKSIQNPLILKEVENEKVIVSVGANEDRHRIAKQLDHEFDIAIHKTACVANRSEIGAGSMILTKAIIQPDVKIGKHVIVNTGAIVEHDCRINDFVHVGPGVVICGGVSVGEGTFIGANATILPGIKIGDWVKIGAGAVVINDIEKNAKVAGNPARRTGI